MEEIWKDVVGYEGLYQVSNIGNVRNKEKQFKLQTCRDGYLYTTFTKDDKPIKKKLHRLVAEAFIPNPENKPQVNHKNEIRSDNRSCNLEWVTVEENNRYSLGKNIMFLHEGEFMNYPSILSASADLGITSDNVTKLVKETSYAVQSLINILNGGHSIAPSPIIPATDDRFITFKNNKYVVRITHGGARHYLGDFKTKEEAIKSRQKFIDKYFPINYHSIPSFKEVSSDLLIVEEHFRQLDNALLSKSFNKIKDFVSKTFGINKEES